MPINNKPAVWFSRNHLTVKKMNTWKAENETAIRPFSTKTDRMIVPWLYLLRHGLSQSNVREKGDNIPPNELVRLTKLGREQAYERGVSFRELKLPPPEVIYVSQFHRTQETLHCFLEGAKITSKFLILESPFLNEIDFGIEDYIYNLSGWHPASFILRTLKEWVAFRSEFFRPKIGGESSSDQLARTRLFFDTVRRNFAGKRIMAVCHSKTISQLLFNIWGSQWEQNYPFLKSVRVPNAGLVALQKSEIGWRLYGWSIEILKPEFFERNDNPFALITPGSLVEKYSK